MRVPNISIYSSATYRLGTITSNLQDANEVVSTQKRINSMSDDPIGLSQVMGMNTNLKGLEQFNRNIDMGKTWLDTGEAALTSTNDSLLELKISIQQLSSAAAGTDQRAAMADNVDNIIKQLVDIGNSQVLDNYIFSGSKISEKPLTFDNELNPTAVVYNGDSNPFSIKTGETSTLEVGRNGAKIFWEDKITIDGSNNSLDFREFSPDYLQAGNELTAVVADGTYTKEELAEAIETAMDKVSATNEGYGLKYDVRFDSTSGTFSIQDDGSKKGAHVELLLGSGTHSGKSIDAIESDQAVLGFTITELNNTFEFREDLGTGLGEPLTVVIPSQDYDSGKSLASKVQYEMNQVSSGGYQVSFNDVTNKFAIRAESGTNLEAFQVNWNSEPSLNSAADALGFTQDDLYPSGGDLSHGVGTSIAPDIGFDSVDIRDAVVSDNKVSFDPATLVSDPITITAGDNDEIVFYEDRDDGYGLQGPMAITLTPGVVYSETGSPDFTDLANEIEALMETASEDYYPEVSGKIDYEVSFDRGKKVFVIQEEGKSRLKELQFDWTASSSAKALGKDLGFDSKISVHTPPASDDAPEWGVFNTLFDLKDYLVANDVEGLTRTLSRLDSHMDQVQSYIADSGLKQNNLEIRVNVMSETTLSVTERRSMVEDADIVQSVMDLKAIETAYEAALASTSKIMSISLVDYM
ncbi:putative flagellin [Desulforapulum autotrophicum HRM2]|uniref:Flagellin n=1 Tax=Desulforapulum autotrophicum (strain ATCC 43914 / DSM 3382 / VKM B-1955 / HRM2) TaxID=177437 RepID=C0QA35_DESAH|nr:flagellar hook-associated protein FlgL [Desulforapulum autotrophicum]ACN16753.1 putative flagellin [Desulforapulum autotrophicum HRM2]